MYQDRCVELVRRWLIADDIGATRERPRTVGDLDHLRPAFKKAVDASLVELSPALFDEVLPRRLQRPCRLIRPHADQRVEDIGHGHNSPRERDGLAPGPVGVSGAIPAFVVADRDLCGERTTSQELSSRIA
jgi:hypothetical protein